MKHKLLVAVDGRRESEKTVRYVTRACVGAAGAECLVILFNVLPALPPSIEAGEPDAAADLRDRFEIVTREAAACMLNGLKEQMVLEGMPDGQIRTEAVANDGNVAEKIRNAAVEHGCDTIVIGRHGRSMFERFMAGSVVEHLLRNPCGLTLWMVE